MSPVILSSVAWVLASCPLPAQEEAVASSSSIDADAPATCEYLGQEALLGRLDGLAAAHPDRARVLDLGTSAGGRRIPALVLAAGEAALAERHGLLLVGGLDGRRLVDGAVLLDVARRLLEDETLAEALAARAVVIVPRANPDGAEALLGDGGPRREQAGNERARDADRDGRVAEDGPADLDGDGLVTWMRIPDPEGEWVLDEHEPRALRKARRERGERGTHRLRREGLDDDGDGAWHEDAGGPEPDRNFPHGFVEYDAASGAYPLCEPEARALADFVRGHPRLGVVLEVGAGDTLVKVPKGAGKPEGRSWRGGMSKPLGGLHEDDVPALTELRRRFRKLDGPKHDVQADALGDGGFLAWAYHQAGRWPVGLKAFAPPEDLPKPDDKDEKEAADEKEEDEKEAADAKEEDEEEDEEEEEEEEDKPGSDADSPVPAAVVAWLQADHDGAGLLPWRAFEHPELGPVEIGGLAPGALFHPPAGAELPLAARLAPFVGVLLDALPAIAFEQLKVTDEGGGIYGIEVALVNTGVLPTATALAGHARTARPVRVRLVAREGTQRLQGPEQELVNRLEGGGGRREFRWVLSGAPGGRVWISADADTVPYVEMEVVLP